MRATFLTVLTIALSPLFFSCKKNAAKRPESQGGGKSAYEIATVEGYVAESSRLAHTVQAPGALIPAEEIQLHTEVAGRVVEINLPEGRLVRKGEVLLRLFDDDLRTQLQKTELQLRQAQITEQRLGELLRVKGVSQQEYDLAALQEQTLKSEIQLLRIQIERARIVAPYDGYIGLRRISPGAYVTPATPVGSIRAIGAPKLDFTVPEKYGAAIRIGQVVRFTVQGALETFSAEVIATEQRINEQTRNLQVRALVRDRHPALIPGAFANVSLDLGANRETLFAPTQAIIPQARNKQVIVSRNGKAEFVTVKTGVRQAGLVEVTEGLKPGDTVAVTGMMFLRPGDPLRFGKLINRS